MAAGEDAEGVEKGVAGVVPEGWKELKTIKDLAEKLVKPSLDLVKLSLDRSHGWLSAQPVLIRAGPGTGKVRYSILRALARWHARAVVARGQRVEVTGR